MTVITTFTLYFCDSYYHFFRVLVFSLTCVTLTLSLRKSSSDSLFFFFLFRFLSFHAFLWFLVLGLSVMWWIVELSSDGSVLFLLFILHTHTDTHVWFHSPYWFSVLYSVLCLSACLSQPFSNFLLSTSCNQVRCRCQCLKCMGWQRLLQQIIIVIFPSTSSQFLYLNSNYSKYMKIEPPSFSYNDNDNKNDSGIVSYVRSTFFKMDWKHNY